MSTSLKVDNWSGRFKRTKIQNSSCSSRAETLLCEANSLFCSHGCVFSGLACWIWDGPPISCPQLRYLQPNKSRKNVYQLHLIFWDHIDVQFVPIQRQGFRNVSSPMKICTAFRIDLMKQSISNLSLVTKIWKLDELRNHDSNGAQVSRATTALFEIMSRVNHSCTPNVRMIGNGRPAQLVALRPIKKQERFAQGRQTTTCTCNGSSTLW